MPETFETLEEARASAQKKANESIEPREVCRWMGKFIVVRPASVTEDEEPIERVFPDMGSKFDI
jgi:hypothetical protein